MRSATALLLSIAVLWSPGASADCPLLRHDRVESVARWLLSRHEIVFTATILKTRYTGKWTGADRFPLEEDYQVINRIKGEIPLPATLRMRCIGEFDCPEDTAEMGKYIKDRAGRKLIVLAAMEKDDSGNRIPVASQCPLLVDMDLSSPYGATLAAAMKRIEDRR